MLKNSILRLSCSTLIFIFTLSNAVFSNGVTAEPQNAPWLGTQWDPPVESIMLTNTVSRELQIDAIRFTAPNTSGAITKNDGFESVNSVDDNNGSDRFQLKLNTNALGSGLENVLLSSDNRTFKMKSSNTAEGVEWTPHSFQYLVKLGSLAEQKVNKDIQGITLKELDSISRLDMFYDEDLYVLDTLGINGSDWGAGFIDTWFDQEKEVPYWQIQTCDVPVEDLTSPADLDTFRFWNEYKAFLPDSLDVNDANYGPTKRPFYMMGLAMSQEYLNIDMQTLMAKGFQESNAGLSMYEGQTAQDTIFDTVIVKDGEAYPSGQTINGWSPWGNHSGADTTIIYIEVKSAQKLFFKYVKYTNRTVNGGTSMGPMHYEEATYKDKIFDAYPKFFPFEGGAYQNSSKFIDAPTGGSPLNSPAIVNAYLISSLYMWYCWQLVVADLGEEALDKMKTHPNRRIMSDAISYAWNAGSDGDFRNRFESGTFDDFIYVQQINGGIEFLEHANRKSEIIGGNRNVYDSPIDKNTLEEFFFGEGGNGNSGSLGTNGLLHHFNLDVSKRTELWSEVDSAFNMLKGRAPSTNGTEMVSYRYDYLAILRIAKKFLDLSIPLPKTVIFKNWVQSGTEPDPNAKSSDKTYPYLVLNSKQKVGNTIQIKTSVEDNRYLNIDSAEVVEWTMDGDWGANNWEAAVKESGADTLKANYTANIDQQYINSTLPSGKDTGIVWIRVMDANFNATLDTVLVLRDENIIVLDPPTFDSCIALDNNGDGEADKIELYLTKASGGEELSNHSNLKYSWPTTTNLLTPAQVSGSSSPLTITDPGKLADGEGLGKVEFSYNTTNFSESIIDRVGPAIDSLGAELSLGATSSDKDTLTITFSENVSGFSNSNIVLAFKKNETDSDTVEVSTASLSGSGDKWIFLFDNGKLQEYNWVKIVSNSALVDNNSNKADENNQLVKIEKSGGNIPSWNIGYIEDTDGDGIGDLITYKITLGSGNDLIDFSDINEINYKFNTMSSEASVSKDSITPSKSTATNIISFKVSGSTTGNYTGITDGEASINFKKDVESITLNGAIKDKIGPAITLSEFVVPEGSEPCTLKVYLSEAIEPISDINTEWFAINGTPTKSTGIIKNSSNGKEWFFILDKGAISTGDSISLISSSGMIDKSSQKNPPLETKFEITINNLSSLIEIENVIFHDLKGNGIMNAVTVTFSKTIELEADINKMNFKATWLDLDGDPITLNIPGTSFNKKGPQSAWWIIDNNTMDSLMKDLTVIGSNYGNISFTQVDPSDTTKTVEKSYDNSIAIDSMAPVIISADYYIFKNGEDTLFVAFSEEITKSISSNTPFKYQDNSKNIQVVHLGAFTSSDIIDFIKIGGDTPEDGDFININNSANITGSNVQDNPSNKYVKLNIYSEIEITDVSYHESNDPFDGLIDLIKVKTDVKVPDGIISKLSDNIELNEDREFNAIESKNITKLSDGDLGFQITVSQKADVTKNTATTLKDILEFTNKIGADNNFIQSTSYNISDSLAPVITLAIVRPVEIDESNYQDEPKDTLYITFTENVNFNTMKSNPFNYKNSNDNVISIDLEKESLIKGFLIDYKSTKLMPNDSITISTSGEISDLINNRQSNDNIYFPIQVDAVEVHWKDAVFPNPLTKTLSEDDIKVLQDELKIPADKIKNRSQAIIISPFGLPPAQDEVSMTIKIFDALGHILAEGELETNGTIWYYIWDCKNLKKRNVGSGVYMATVQILPETMGSVDNIIKIGIQN